MKIKSVHGRQILDSRGNPTVEADVILESGVRGRASVPSGASTGSHEALELRDKDASKYGGMGETRAVANVNDEIAREIVGMEVSRQRAIDRKMIELDGTGNKSRLGANAILAVSMAVAKAAAEEEKMPLYKYFGRLADKSLDPGSESWMTKGAEDNNGSKGPDGAKPANLLDPSRRWDDNNEWLLPMPMENIVNGGKHAEHSTDIQEFMIVPVGAKSFSEAVRMGAEVFHELGKVLDEAGYGTTVGDEGGYAPTVKNGNQEALNLIDVAVQKAGYILGDDMVLALDLAASEFYENGQYNLRVEDRQLSSDGMIAWLDEVRQKYPIVSIEDGLAEGDWNGWRELTKRLGDKVQLVGDDLLATNANFLQKAINERAANAILVKLNQIGTISETIDVVQLAQEAGWKAIVSHRSGETEDVTIVHLAVGLGTGQIKTGSLSRTDRVAKYNELLRIEEELGAAGGFAGREALKVKGM